MPTCNAGCVAQECESRIPCHANSETLNYAGLCARSWKDKAVNHKRVLVSGGGIGGLSAALSLASQGFEIKLIEQAAEFGEVGAGIQLSPNATRVLFSLGLEAKLRELCFVPEDAQVRSWNTGAVLATYPLGKRLEATHGFPFLQAHRADLIEVLACAANSHGSIELMTNSRVTGFAEDGAGVRLFYVRGGSHAVEDGDLLIGADGIGSVVREALFGPESPRFTGNVAWRAVVPASRLSEGLARPKATVWWGPGSHFVHYFVRGGALVNCVCVVEKRGWEVESWHEQGAYEELKEDFKGWHEDIQTLLDSADRGSLYKWALFDRLPMPSWGRGSVTLLGDACHPTLPFMAQGAAMAIEDGAVLARCLSRADSRTEMQAALVTYADLRRPRTERIQQRSRRNGRIFHMRGIVAGFRNLAARLSLPRDPWGGLFAYDALCAHEQRS